VTLGTFLALETITVSGPGQNWAVNFYTVFDILDAEGAVETQEDELETLKEDLEALEDDISAIEADIDEIEDDIASIEEEIAAIEDDVETLKEDIEELEEESEEDNDDEIPGFTTILLILSALVAIASYYKKEKQMRNPLQIPLNSKKKFFSLFFIIFSSDT